MTDQLTVQRRLTAVAYAQAQAAAVGIACPVCTLQIAKQIDDFLVSGDVPAHAPPPDHAVPEVEVASDDAAGVVTPFPKKPH